MRDSQFVQTGIGDRNDLLVKISPTQTILESPSIRVRKGWYYIDGSEGYRYASVGTQAINVGVGINSTTIPNSFLLAIYGPLLMRSVSRDYIQVDNNLAVWESHTPVATTGNLLQVSFSVLPLEVVDATQKLTQVNNVSQLINSSVWCWDGTHITIARDPLSPTRLAPLYITYPKTPDLYQGELLQTTDGVSLTLSLERPTNITLTCQGVTLSVSNVVNNKVTFTPSVPLNTLIGVSYLVDGSFLALGTVLQTYSSFSESALFNYETGKEWGDASSDPNSSDYIQLNPLLRETSGGFIALSTPRPSQWGLASLELHVSQSIIFPGQILRIRVTALDVSGNPLPDIAVSVALSINGTPSSISPLEGERAGLTDSNGNRHFWWQAIGPNVTGTLTATAYKTDTTPVHSVFTFSVFPNLLSNPSFSSLPKLFLYLSPTKDANNCQALYIHVADQSGVLLGYQPLVQVNCESGSLYNADNSGGGQVLQPAWPATPTSDSTLKTLRILYKANGPDEIVAFVPSATVPWQSTPLVINVS